MLRPLLTLLLLITLLPAAAAQDRVRLATEHVDLRILLAPDGTNQFQLTVFDHDANISHPATNVVLVVPESARLNVPDGLPELGSPGAPLWVLPQSQNDALLYLGISGEYLPSGVLSGRPDLLLRRLDGPAQFVAWQFDPAAGLAIRLNSRDGLTEADRLSPLVGGHEHVNWGFSTNGLVTAWFQVRATLGGTNAWSAETPLLFAVEPLPTSKCQAATLRVAGYSSSPSGNVLTLAVRGSPGCTYRLERSSDLSDWTLVNEVEVTGDTETTLPAAADGHTFYRASSP